MKKFLMSSLIILLFVASCSINQKPEMTNTAAPANSEPFSTATAYAAPKSIDNYYVSEEYGFSIAIPSGFTAEDAPVDAGYFQDYTMGDNEGFGYLTPAIMTEGDTLETVGKQAIVSQATGLENMKILQDEEITLSDGSRAWYTQLTGYFPSWDDDMEIRLTTAINAGRAITLVLYTNPGNFLGWNRESDNMRDSLALHSPQVNGLPRSQVLMLSGGETSNPREYDPATTHGSGDYLIFEGLVTFNQKLEIVPALAAGWDVSDSGTVYTFHLQTDAVFHNGKPFTAADVVYSWQRAANPDTQSDTVMTYLSDIVGVKEMNEGNADSISGLKVIDDYTLQVTIDAPKPYFLYKLTYPTANIVDKANVESGSEWYRTPNGTGPYRLTRWESMVSMIYERFEGYYGVKPSIPMVVYNLYGGDDFRLYEAGSIDITGVYDYNVERVSDPSDPLSKELLSGVSLCTSYVQFDVTKPPFDDVKVRQAFTLAFDKAKYLDVVLMNTDVPAKGIYPPALPGFSQDLQGFGYDPELARQLITESKYGSVDAFPEIVISTSGYGSYADSLVSALSDMWQKNLGVEVTVRNLDPNTFLEDSSKQDYGQVTTTGWCADYPDPENFADVLFHTGAGMNKGNYSNPNLDRILEQARVEMDVTKRIDLYQQAETIIVEDAPVLFLFHSGDFELVKPYIKGYILSPVSTYPQIRYLSIDQSYWK
jgi:oligopeptide transport system substrate-binding protein